MRSLENQILPLRERILGLLSATGGERKTYTYDGTDTRDNKDDKEAEEGVKSPDKETDNDTTLSLLPQILGTLMASLAQIDVGAIAAYPAVALPQLLDETSDDLVFDTAQTALFGSVIFLGAMIGSLFGGLPMVRVGQRATLLIALPLSFAAWITLCLAPSFWVILTARFFQGIALSLISCASNLYVTEIAHSSIRGRLTATPDFCRHAGVLFVYCIGLTPLSWRQVALTVGFSNTVMPFVGLIFLPNSPRWLATRDRTKDAHRALTFFRGSKYNTDEEFEDILSQLKNSSDQKLTTLQQLRHMREPSILRYVIIMSIVFFVVHFNGNTIMLAYVTIIMNTTQAQMSSYVAAIVIGVSTITGTFCLGLILDRFNRKTLFTVASSLSALATAVMGGFFYDQVHGTYIQHLQWLPLICLVVQGGAAATPLVNLFRNELFPTSVRSTVVPTLYGVFFVGAFVSLQTYPYIVEAVGNHGAFWMFAMCNVVLLLLVLLTIPETRGKTLEQITEMQQRNAAKNDSKAPFPHRKLSMETPVGRQ